MQDIFWESIEDKGFEHLKFTKQKDLLYFDGIIIRTIEGKNHRVFYKLVCDSSWQFRNLELTVENDTKKSLKLSIDKSGLWYDDKGLWYQQLSECIEPHISFTSLTNTLPIGRLNLQEGEMATITAAYINLPDLTIAPVKQSYQCISRDANGGVYLYKNMDSGVEAELQVDSNSFVIHYPDLFRRV